MRKDLCPQGVEGLRKRPKASAIEGETDIPRWARSCVGKNYSQELAFEIGSEGWLRSDREQNEVQRGGTTCPTPHS